MKKFEIVIRGANEEAVAHAVMVGVYGAIRKYKHTDVSVQAATVKEGWVREVDNGWMGTGHRACREAHQKAVAYGLCYHVL